MSTEESPAQDACMHAHLVDGTRQKAQHHLTNARLVRCRQMHHSDTSGCMQAHLVDGKAVVGEVAALLVQRVAGLMDGARESLGQIALLEACCHAHIRRVRPCGTPRLTIFLYLLSRVWAA